VRQVVQWGVTFPRVGKVAGCWAWRYVGNACHGLPGQRTTVDKYLSRCRRSRATSLGAAFKLSLAHFFAKLDRLLSPPLTGHLLDNFANWTEPLFAPRTPLFSDDGNAQLENEGQVSGFRTCLSPRPSGTFCTTGLPDKKREPTHLAGGPVDHLRVRGT
jgi:hypothetical protein